LDVKRCAGLLAVVAAQAVLFVVENASVAGNVAELELKPPAFVPLPVSDHAVTLELELTYSFWDPKIEGDVYSSETVLKLKVRMAAGEEGKAVIYLQRGGALMTILAKRVAGPSPNVGIDRKLPLDDSFFRDDHPRRNYDGTYVIAEKPVDPRAHLPLADMGEAVSWFQLGITPQP
jgi:hypothetical protein